MIQTKEIAWIGYCKRSHPYKEGKNEIKVLDIPFKIPDSRTKYLLKIIKNRSDKTFTLTYEVREITHERVGMFETLLLHTYKNETNPLIDTILKHRKVKWEYRRLIGWF